MVSRRSGEQVGQGLAGLFGAHESFANQECVHLSVAHALHIGGCDAAFGDDDAIRSTMSFSARVVSSETSKVLRLRLLMPTRGVFSFNARSISTWSCTSTSTAMSRLRAMASNRPSAYPTGSGNQQDAVCPMARDS